VTLGKRAPDGTNSSQKDLFIVYRVHFQDYTYWRPFSGQKRPPVETRDFPTLERAEAFRAAMPHDDCLLATITPVPTPRAKRKQLAPELPGGRMRAVGRSLTL
jgi:hypothetical protein